MLFTSCLKDKGNYEYTDLPLFYVDTVGLRTSFEVQQSVQDVVIDPAIVYDGSSELTYQWRLYAGGETFDTLSTQKVLRSPISQSPGAYTVELQVTQKANGLSALMRYRIQVVPPISSGWMVAYEKDGKTDIDIIRAPEFIAGVQDTILRKALSASNGAPLDGSPVSVLFLSNAISYIFTTTTGIKVQNTDLQKVQNFSQLFLGTPPSIIKPEAFWLGTFNRGALVNNKAVYWFDTDRIVGQVVADEKGYEAAPYVYYNYGNYAGFYDQKNMRFLIIKQYTSIAGKHGDASGSARFNLNNIGKKLLFVERGFGQGRPGDPYKYAFFKDVNGNQRFLYVINTSSDTNPDVAAVDISNAPEIVDAKFYLIGNLGPCGFYATSKTLYNFQIDLAGNTISNPTIGFKAKDNEEITCVKLFKGQGTFGTGAISSPFESSLVYISSWNVNTKTSTIQLHRVNITTGAIGQAPLRQWTIDGKVLDMNYKQQ